MHVTSVDISTGLSLATSPGISSTDSFSIEKITLKNGFSIALILNLWEYSQVFSLHRRIPFKCAVLISEPNGILIDIGYNNPNCFPFIAGLMSDYIPKLSKQSQLDLLVRVQEKIGTLSNAGLLEIWIQRIALGLKLKLDFDETLCKYAYGDYKQKIFTNDWISEKTIKDILSNGVFVNRAVIDKIKPKIERREIQVFSYES